MHAALPSILILWSLAACGKPPVAWPDDASGPMNMPPEVILLADPFLASQPERQNLPRARRDYRGQFLYGLMHPDQRRDFEAYAAPLFVQPFLLGQEYRRKNAARLDEVMRGFGYEPKSVEGEYTVGFESSVLRPSQEYGGSWWLEHMAVIQLPWPKEEPGLRVCRSMQVRATGYLSSPGHYGHLGASHREFLAMTMVPLGKDQSSK